MQKFAFFASSLSSPWFRFIILDCWHYLKPASGILNMSYHFQLLKIFKCTCIPSINSDREIIPTYQITIVQDFISYYINSHNIDFVPVFIKEETEAQGRKAAQVQDQSRPVFKHWSPCFFSQIAFAPYQGENPECVALHTNPPPAPQLCLLYGS